MLGLSRGGFTPRLMFFQEPTAMGYFEVYGSLPNFEDVDVALELATTRPKAPRLSACPRF